MLRTPTIEPNCAAAVFCATVWPLTLRSCDEVAEPVCTVLRIVVSDCSAVLARLMLTLTLVIVSV